MACRSALDPTPGVHDAERAPDTTQPWAQPMRLVTVTARFTAHPPLGLWWTKDVSPAAPPSRLPHPPALLRHVLICPAPLPCPALI
jgi:hypothetical protein